jgi:hypothetical protein
VRVTDIDFVYRQIVVRDPKGAHDRFTILPASVIEPLKEHLASVKRQHQEDLAKGYGAAHLPFALSEKYPNAEREWAWQYVFPSARLAYDPQAKTMRRWYTSETTLQRAIKTAAQKVGVNKVIGPHANPRRSERVMVDRSGAPSGRWAIEKSWRPRSVFGRHNKNRQ